jgi:hypothetical protein
MNWSASACGQKKQPAHEYHQPSKTPNQWDRLKEDQASAEHRKERPGQQGTQNG